MENKEITINKLKSIAGCIIINKNNEILLQKKTQDYKYPGHWCLFGGEIEGSETPEEAIIRELKEELGIDITDVKKIKESDYEFNNKKEKVYIFTALFDKDISEIRIGEGCGVALFTLEEIKELKLIPHVLDIIMEFLENKNKEDNKNI